MSPPPPVCNSGSVQEGTPFHTLLVVLAVAWPVFCLACVLVFRHYQQTSLYLRKRSLGAIYMDAALTAGPWFVLVVYDLVDQQGVFPCGLWHLLFYLSYMGVMAPTQYTVFRYNVEVAAGKLRTYLHGLQPDDPLVVEFGDLSAEGSWRTLTAYYHVGFTKRQCSKREKILAAKFGRSRAFVWVWLLCTTLPYLIAYFIRLMVDPSWRECYGGCDVDYIDACIMLVLTSSAGAVGFAVVRKSRKRRDPLGIMQESALTWLIGVGISNVTCVLLLVDIDGVQRNGHFKWKVLFSVTILGCLYLHSVHQVLLAQQHTRRLVLTDKTNSEERLAQVLADKNLREDLKSHMDRELSNEILLFLESVEAFRDSPTPELAADIRAKFIAKHAPMEVNLSHAVRDGALLTHEFGAGMFDAAYELIRAAFINDGFARFLLRLEHDQHHRSKQQQQSTPGAAAAITHNNNNRRVSNATDHLPPTTTIMPPSGEKEVAVVPWNAQQQEEQDKQ